MSERRSVLGSLAEVEAVPALVTDTEDSFTSLHAEEAQDDAARNNEIVVQTSQFYGIDLVTFIDENKTYSNSNSNVDINLQTVPPPLPARREYRIEGGVKIFYRN